MLTKFYHAYRALHSGKQVFWIPTLHRICFADDEVQCRSKFTKHPVKRLGWLFGYLWPLPVNKACALIFRSK